MLTDLDFDALTSTTVLIAGKPWTQWSNGKLLPVVQGGDGSGGEGDAGAAGAAGAEDGAGAGEEGAGGGKAAEEEFDADRAKAKIAKQNSEAKSLRDRLHAAEGRLKAIDDSTKTESQKLTEDRDTHKGRAEKAELEVMRYRVALKKGLTETQAKRLVGSTEDEMETDADELLASFGGGGGGGNDGKQRPGGKPREALRSGAGADNGPEETDPAKLAALIPRS